MTETIAWSLFLIALAALMPASRFVERVTGRKGTPTGLAALAYYVLLGGGVAISVLLIGYTFHPSISASAALAGACGGVWSLVAQAALGEKRT